MAIDFTKGNISKQIWNFTVPMLLGNVFQQFYNLTDSIIVGRVLGKEALAAVGASFPVIFLIISFIFGISTGFTVIISQYFGAKKTEGIEKTIHTMYIFIGIVGILFSILSIVFCRDIFELLKLPEELLDQAHSYLRIFLIGLTFNFGFNFTNAALRGIGDSKTPLYFLIISTFLNICLDLLFVVVFKIGIVGAAFATVFAILISLLGLLVYLRRKQSIIAINFSKLNFHKSIFLKSIKIGFPTGIQMVVVSLGMIVVLGIVNTFGTDVIAAYTAAGRIDSLAVIPAMIFGQAFTSFVGQNIGAKNFERVKRGVKITFMQSGAISILLTIVIIFFGNQLILLFNTDENVLKIGKKYLVIVSSFYFIFAALFIYIGALHGAGDTIIPMFITLFSFFVVRIPVAYLLSKEINEEGIWWSLPMTWFVGFILAYTYYHTGRWKKMHIVHKYVD